MQQEKLCLIRIRDTVADMISRLDADPPKDNQEYFAKKTWLMAMWRCISLLRVQTA